MSSLHRFIKLTLQWFQPGRHWLIVLSVITFIGSLPAMVDLFGYEAELVDQGQVWRPFTAWLTQLNFSHWLLNQWGVVVLWLLWPRRLELRQFSGYLAVWLISSVMLALSDYQAYVGLSGLLYGWLTLAAVRTPFYPMWVKLVFLSMLSAKVLVENVLPQTDTNGWVGEFIAAEVAHESHLWGLISGWAAVLVGWIVQRVQSEPESRD